MRACEVCYCPRLAPSAYCLFSCKWGDREINSALQIRRTAAAYHHSHFFIPANCHAGIVAGPEIGFGEKIFAVLGLGCWMDTVQWVLFTGSKYKWPLQNSAVCFLNRMSLICQNCYIKWWLHQNLRGSLLYPCEIRSMLRLLVSHWSLSCAMLHFRPFAPAHRTFRGEPDSTTRFAMIREKSNVGRQISLFSGLLFDE